MRFIGKLVLPAKRTRLGEGFPLPGEDHTA